MLFTTTTSILRKRFENAVSACRSPISEKILCCWERGGRDIIVEDYKWPVLTEKLSELRFPVM
ncbi:hypothetical protein NC651_031687 [Populus alba x Populus x berolinensis]|nr:hypothetical protein NC651_031687 [Populus alba x Populus x berolinensis]